jgi:hypothetical protein
MLIGPLPVPVGMPAGPGGFGGTDARLCAPPGPRPEPPRAPQHLLSPVRQERSQSLRERVDGWPTAAAKGQHAGHSGTQDDGSIEVEVVAVT